MKIEEVLLNIAFDARLNNVTTDETIECLESYKGKDELNARLIAAAPEMFELLKILTKAPLPDEAPASAFWEDGRQQIVARERSKELIQKIEGNE